MKQMRQIVGWDAENAYVDKGYKGTSDWRWYKRRNAVEPVIGHMKHDNRMNRNYLKGIEGDKMNAILAACGFNLRKLL